jgi:hypothetical protein
MVIGLVSDCTVNYRPVFSSERAPSKEEKSNCQTKKEEQDQILSRVPKGGPIPRLTGRLTVGRKKNSNSSNSANNTTAIQDIQKGNRRNKLIRRKWTTKEINTTP